ncbi:MAG TPA: hypothetical protein PKZ32_18310 [Candidatus Melainabacteria bacterium]|nr:hypothetical protein [Candidatus Melainabacteria bacterium]
MLSETLTTASQTAQCLQRLQSVARFIPNAQGFLLMLRAITGRFNK